MAETFLFQIAGQILGKLTTLSVTGTSLLWGMEKELNRLEITLSAIKAVLLDADEQQAKSQQVKDWLEKLNELLYDADDVLDDFATETLRQEMTSKDRKHKKVGKFFSRSNTLLFRVSMTQKIKKLRERMENIAADRKNFSFTERFLDAKATNRMREQTHSFVLASDVIGRDLDKEHIVSLLLASNMLKNISVLPIVGLGGIGKTTLAKLVYNDQRIVENFEKRIWVYIPEEFDLKMLTERIIRAATGADNAHLDLDQLQICLRDELMSKKFLLVLDDVWNEDPKRWLDLRDLLTCGAEGSRIIVTTRNKVVASIMGTSAPYELECLSNNECLSIFVKCAFKEGQVNANPELLEIGKAIVNKCGGIPLAVRTLGSLLCTKTEERDWLYIKDNDILNISQKENDILPILRLSYDQMRSSLKQCFSYCSIFPKDYHIPREELINLWIAQGFVQSEESRLLEEIGNEYFNELLSRSFFQDVEEAFDCEVLTCRMHDLVHDLARSVAGTLFSYVNFDTKSISKRVRHLLFCEENLLDKEFPGLLLLRKKVRSFSFSFKVGPISQPFLDILISTFECLRVLDLSESDFENLPKSIGSLAHLRYLSLYGNHTIQKLPNSICNLLNMQTLYLLGCVQLQDLPRDFGNLCSLRHLYLTSTMKCLPKNCLKGLCALQSLSISRCCNLESLSEEIKYLTALRALYIIQCPALISLPENLHHLTSLEKLWIMDCEMFGTLNGEAVKGLKTLQSLVVRGLPKLKELPCELQQGTTLRYMLIQQCPSLLAMPQWLESCASLSKLKLVNCSSLETLPLGIHKLTALRVLFVKGCPLLNLSRESAEHMSWMSNISEVYINQDTHVSYNQDYSRDLKIPSVILQRKNPRLGDNLGPWAPWHGFDQP